MVDTIFTLIFVFLVLIQTQSILLWIIIQGFKFKI